MLKAITNLFKKRTNDVSDNKLIYSWINKDLGEVHDKVTSIIERLHLDLNILHDSEVACEARIKYETQRLSEIRKQKEETQDKADKALALLTTIEQLKIQQDRP